MSLSRKVVALLAVAAVLLAACGDDTEDASTPGDTATASEPEAAEATEDEPAGTGGGATASEQPPVVRADADLVIWADDTRRPVITPFAEAFAAAEDLTVAVQELDFQDLRDRLVVAGPAGEGPDIIIGAHDWLGELVTNGVVAPLDLSGVAADYAEVAVEAFTYDGQTYGLPYAIENIALVRNTDLVPEAPATWEDLVETALALQADGTVEHGLVIQAADVYHHYPLVTAHGGYVFGRDADGSYDASDVGIDSEGGLAAAAAIGGWVARGLLNPDVDYDVMINAFGQGQAAFAITGPWAVAEADRGFAATGVPYEITPLPPVAGGTPQPFVGVQGLMVSSFAENPLLATTFLLDHMATGEAQLALFEAGRRPPAMLSAFEQVAADPDIAGFGLSGQDGVPMPAIPEMGSVWTAWEDAYLLIYEQEGEPAEHFRNAGDQVRTLIGG